MSGWADLSEQSYRLRARVNHSLTAVPPSGVNADTERTALAGKLYLFGGDDGTDPRNDLWVYDLATGAWEEPDFRGTRPSPRCCRRRASRCRRSRRTTR